MRLPGLPRAEKARPPMFPTHPTVDCPPGSVSVHSLLSFKIVRCLLRAVAAAVDRRGSSPAKLSGDDRSEASL